MKLTSFQKMLLRAAHREGILRQSLAVYHKQGVADLIQAGLVDVTRDTLKITKRGRAVLAATKI